MSEKNSLANKKKWAKISREDRSRIMSERAKGRWAKTSTEERRKISMMLVGSRKKRSMNSA